MILVGVGKPCVVEHSPDSHHPEQGSWFAASEPFWVDEVTWLNIREFEDFDMNPPDKDLAGDGLMKLLRTDYASRMEWLLKLAGGRQLWEMNCPNFRLDGWVRQTFALGDGNRKWYTPCRRWTWFDVFVKYRLTQFWAWMKNLCEPFFREAY